MRDQTAIKPEIHVFKYDNPICSCNTFKDIGKIHPWGNLQENAIRFMFKVGAIYHHVDRMDSSVFDVSDSDKIVIVSMHVFLNRLFNQFGTETKKVLIKNSGNTMLWEFPETNTFAKYWNRLIPQNSGGLSAINCQDLHNKNNIGMRNAITGKFDYCCYKDPTKTNEELSSCILMNSNRKFCKDYFPILRTLDNTQALPLDKLIMLFSEKYEHEMSLKTFGEWESEALKKKYVIM